MAATWQLSGARVDACERHQPRQARYKKGEGAGLGHCCRCHRQIAEQAMRLVVDTGAEVDGVGIDAGAAIANGERPQTVNRNRVAIAVEQCA